MTEKQRGVCLTLSLFLAPLQKMPRARDEESRSTDGENKDTSSIYRPSLLWLDNHRG